MEGKEIFQHAGGKDYFAIPCMNSHPEWIRAMQHIVEENLQGWILTPESQKSVTERQARVDLVQASLS